MEVKEEEIIFFKENGYLVVQNIISTSEIAEYKSIYDDFLNGNINTGKNRSDLGGGDENLKVEKITQIMWPSDFVSRLHEMTFHKSSLSVAKQLLGSDIELDFDMMIDKAPNTNTPTPWHQDASYWPNLPDIRAVSCWLALDEATLDNGCMWYVPKSHLLPLRQHKFAGKEGGALSCDCDESEGIGIPILGGTCIFHDGRTLHYSRGNSTNGHRRAMITNFRPAEMIELERAQGFDHGRSGNAGDRKVRS